MSSNSNADIWIAGAFAAFTVDLLVYPLDTIKTRLQSPDYKRLYTNGADKSVNRALFRGVYQGLGSVVIATLPSSGAFFTTYEGVKFALSNHVPSVSGTPLLPTPLIHSMASATGELVSCAILTPAEVIKQNAQMVDNSSSDKPKVNATVQTLKRFRSNPLALWRGYTALAGRNLPFTALQFPMFERLREGVKSYRDERGIRTNTLLEGGVITAASAGTAGSVAAVVTTPVDVVKTRIMLAAAEGAAEDAEQTSRTRPASPHKRAIREPGKHAIVDATGQSIGHAKESAKETIDAAKDSVKDAVKNVTKPPSSKGSIQIAKEIIAENGLKGLFRGGALRGIWTMIGSGLYLGVYESGRIYLAERRGEKADIDDL
ncbi:mitochondrial carrier protein [Polychaeton citri CBS 116435]|uniref:Mitochondrial carrier protein n=1 Tax=Polychaeton citri CBS 116435 TaxID=1314669 RepID=A0A9P4UJ49_9PEZI|nr:mitochondrial carrier protein [Polychaeton citri CBS 116435]